MSNTPNSNQSGNPETEQSESLGSLAWKKIRGLFRLSLDTDRRGAISSLEEGVEFRGNGIWSLVIAIFIASIGLNVNSPAIIIGAMLISPLMGPVAGAGLALSIYDMALLRRSLFNLGILTVTSVIASAIYFSVSPLSGTTPELLARTTPTFFDVLIAILGGTALIISVSRKNPSTNSLAGVAIATALMPPLCTAGYGLANKDLSIFLGAIYLYLINSVFIGLSIFVFAKYLKLRAPERGAHRFFTKKNLILFGLVALLFVTPSIFMAAGVIQETKFRTLSDKFISENMSFTNSQVTNVNRLDKNNQKTLEVTIVGAPLSNEMISRLQSELNQSGLPDVKLKIIQYSNDSPIRSSANVVQNPAGPPLQAQSQPQSTASTDQTNQAPKTASAEVEALRKELKRYTDKNEILRQTTKELSFLFPNLEKISYGDMQVSDNTPLAAEKKYTVLTKWQNQVDQSTKTKLMLYLKLRLGVEDLDIVDM